MFDLGIINGRVYFGKEYRVTNVYIKAGKIVEISKEIFECERTMDATKKIVLPGFIDSHVHFALKVGEFESADDFESGSKTAAYGGVTTFLDFTDPILHHSEFKDALEKRKKQAEKSCIDYSFHTTVGDFKGDAETLKILCKDEGINSIKVFTTYSETGRQCSYEMIDKLFDQEMTIMAHCEEEDLLKKRWENPATFEKSRPVMAERSAAMHMADMAERKKSRLYIVHISSGSTLDMIKLKHPREIGKSIFLESCPHYFYLSDVKLSNIDGNLYLLTPPLRGGKELMRLRSSIALIDAISTDHCPFMIEEKMRYEMAYQVPMGIGGVEHSFPLMFNLFGDAIIPKFTSKPAEIFGLKNKGEIKVGKDADFEHIGESFLPVMRTDIVLQNEKSQLIIDAKYYTNALQIRNVGDTKKLISGNLYQIYTYINNSTFTGEKAGMLIYPVVDTELDFVYSIQGKKIYVKTLNLNTRWENIYGRLKKIAAVI